MFVDGEEKVLQNERQDGPDAFVEEETKILEKIKEQHDVIEVERKVGRHDIRPNENQPNDVKHNFQHNDH